MSNISNLTSKIIRDAEERKDSVLAKAESEKASIVEKKNKEANTIKAEMIEKAKSEAVTRKERVISSAELKARNQKLKAKQTVIEEVFNKSIEGLCALDKDAYKNYIVDGIKALTLQGDEKLILNQEGLKLIDEKTLGEINKAVKGNLTFSKEVGTFKGGFILEKNGIEINNTFEALVSALRNELEFEVANVLFN